MRPGELHSEATKQKMREASKRRWERAEEHAPLREETKRKIGEANKGRKRSMATKRKIKQAAYRRWARERARRESKTAE